MEGRGLTERKLARYRSTGSFFVVVTVVVVTALATFAVALRAALSDGADDPDGVERRDEAAPNGLGDGGVDFFEIHDVNDFEFMVAYVVELVLNYLLYYFVIGTLLFSGVMTCGRFPVIGGRPYELKIQKEAKQMAKLEEGRRKVLVNKQMLSATISSPNVMVTKHEEILHETKKVSMDPPSTKARDTIHVHEHPADSTNISDSLPRTDHGPRSSLTDGKTNDMSKSHHGPKSSSMCGNTNDISNSCHGPRSSLSDSKTNDMNKSYHGPRSSLTQSKTDEMSKSFHGPRTNIDKSGVDLKTRHVDRSPPPHADGPASDVRQIKPRHHAKCNELDGSDHTSMTKTSTNSSIHGTGNRGNRKNNVSGNKNAKPHLDSLCISDHGPRNRSSKQTNHIDNDKVTTSITRPVSSTNVIAGQPSPNAAICSTLTAGKPPRSPQQDVIIHTQEIVRKQFTQPSKSAPTNVADQQPSPGLADKNGIDPL